MRTTGTTKCQSTRITWELLPNGYVRVRSSSGLVGLWATDGEARHGDLTRTVDATGIGRVVRAAMERGAPRGSFDIERHRLT